MKKRMRVNLKYTPFKPFLFILVFYVVLCVLMVIKPYNQYYNEYMMYFYVLISILTFVLFYFGWQLYLYNILRIVDFKKIIVLNSLYKRFPDNVQEVVNTKKGFSVKEVVTYQVTMNVECTKQEFSISFLLDGTSYSERCKDVQDLLTDLLGLTLKNIVYKTEKGKSYITYVFYRYKGIRIIFDKLHEVSQYEPIRLNNNYLWDFSKSPNGLIVGGIGSGKTHFLLYLIIQFKLRKANIRILDPKNMDLVEIANILNIESVAISTGRIIQELRFAVEEMEKRSHIFQEKGIKLGEDYRYYEIEPYILFFDEVSAALTLAEKKEREEIDKYYKQIVLKGRQLGVFLVLATQRPDASIISGDIRDNLSLRVALGSMSSDGYRMVFDNEMAKPLHKLEQGQAWLYIDGLSWLNCRFFEIPTIKTDITSLEWGVVQMQTEDEVKA